MRKSRFQWTASLSSSQFCHQSNFTSENVKKLCRYSKPILSPAMACRKALLRKIQKRALRDLRSLVPTLKNRPRIDEVTIVREAARYIDQLEATVMARLNSGSLNMNSFSKCVQFPMEEIKKRFLVGQIYSDENSGSSAAPASSDHDESTKE